ncbi:receptor-type tyrosine-protein phosphatase alpha-like isoform X2 [Lineus longissimus]
MPTKQKSTLADFTPSSAAVDGSTSTTWTSCTQTKADDDIPWWRVDMGREFVLFKVMLYNRNCAGKCGQTLQNFIIWVSNVDNPDIAQGTGVCNSYPGMVANGETAEITCNKPVIGRYLFVKIMMTGTLALCEVKTWAYQFRKCPTGFYGPNCNYQCQCANSKGCGVEAGKCSQSCKVGYTGPYCNIEIPTVSKLGPSDDSSIMVKWPVKRAQTNAPNYGQVQRYRLQYKKNDGTFRWFDHNDEMVVLPTSTWFSLNVTGLEGHTEYSFRLVVQYKGSTDGVNLWGPPGPSSNLWTRCGAPAEGPSIISIKPGKLFNSTIITIKEIPKSKANCQSITFYAIHYKLMGPKSARWNNHETSSPVTSVKGLHVNANYSFIVAVINSGGLRKNGTVAYFIIPKGYKFDPIILGICITCAILLIIVIVIGILVYQMVRKRRRKTIVETDTEPANVPLSLIMPGARGNNTEDNLTDSVRHLLPQRKENVVRSEIHENYDVKSKAFYDMPVADLLSIVMAKKSNHAIELKAEFKTFPEKLTDAHTVAESKINMKKNRFRNIVPYDHTRVVLDPIDSVPSSDYINASYVESYEKQLKFIAAQGPLANTINDFWRLIWQEKCATIAMVSNYVEMGKLKCVRYLPSESQPVEVNGEITVTLINMNRLPNFTMTTLEAKKGDEKRNIHHFHFTTWPDHGAPKFASSMVEFWRRVSSTASQQSDTAVLVHCSAGIGRTGTFLAIDYLFRQGEAEDKVNAHECILEMRKFRTNMVQTPDQYIFIHEALVQYFNVGRTAILCSTFLDEYRKLSSPEEPGRRSKLKEQHELLSMFDTFHAEKRYSDARSPQNVPKNRSAAILPDNSSWARLSSPIEGRNNYINAVHVDGFAQKNTFIATQFPLPSTVVDFWRLVYDHEVETIVTMEPLPEGEHQFWPSSGHYLKFGPLQIKCTTTDENNTDFTIRDFALTLKSTNQKEPPMKKEVRQYHFMPWATNSHVPSDAQAVVNLLSAVMARQDRMGAGPILVNCLDGALHSGVFCATHCVMEKVKIEQEVDIFELSRLIRVNRPQFLQHFEQYQFIHDVMVAYLHGFDTYANYR